MSQPIPASPSESRPGHTGAENRKTGVFSQPKAVWAVAFACVISFMGIGLVDPILPTLAEGLHASPAQVSLLFTSYLVVTAVAMLGVGWVSSRIGSKRALLAGLLLIVVFSALAGAASSVGQIIGFRGGWGLGNALFISTSLAVIVVSARGGVSGAIILYEAALGVGMATGPLLGGLLGAISWRGPFFGVAVLMAIALVASLLFIPKQEPPAEKIALSAPLRALRHRGLLIIGIMALLYNWGFFTMLGYAPYPMELDAFHLGLVFTAWGLLVALFAVVLAPRLRARFGTVPVLLANLIGLAVVMIAIAVGIAHPPVVIAAVIVSGAFIGINNTLTTQAVMLVAPVDRSVASSAYGFVRFIGGGLAPFVAGKIAEASSPSVAFLVGAAAFVLAVPVLASGRREVTAAERSETTPEPAQGGLPLGAEQPVVVAIHDRSTATTLVDAAIDLALRDRAPLEVVHVRETDVLADVAVSADAADDARELVDAMILRASDHGVAAHGLILTSVGDHAGAGRTLAAHCERVGARCVVIGDAHPSRLARAIDGSLTAGVAAGTSRPIIRVPSRSSAPEARV